MFVITSEQTTREMQFKENIFEGKQCCYHLIIGFKDPALKAYVRQLSNYPIVQLNLETFK